MKEGNAWRIDGQYACTAQYQIHFHASPTGFNQGQNQGFIGQGIHFQYNACRFAGLGQFYFVLDGPQDVGVQAERRDPQVVELAAFAKAGQLLEHLVHVGADFLVGGEQAEVSVKLGGA